MMKIKHHFLQTVSSTQDWAKEHASSFDLDQLHVVCAQEQTKGRGRFKRRWFSPKNANIYSTLCFSKTSDASISSALSLVMGLTISEVLQKFGLSPKIKWPNDIYINEKKVGGILIEVVNQGAFPLYLCGYGLNVNMSLEQLAMIDCPATSLFAETQKTWALSSIMKPIEMLFLRNLSIFLEKGFKAFEADFESISFLAGKTITINNAKETFYGKYVKINESGALILKLDDNTQREIISGEITNWE